MKNMVFAELLEQENKKISKIESEMDKTKQGVLFTKEVESLYKTLSLTHHAEVNEALENLQIPIILQKTIKTVESKIDLIKSYKVDIASQQIILTPMLGNQNIIAPTMTIQEIIDKKVKINKNHEMYYVIMSLIMGDITFEMFQLEKALEQI
jgi:hypothetical protein